MKDILEYLELKQVSFARHPFLRRLDEDEPLARVLPFATYLTFWVMVFQDILRLNDARVADPHLKKMSRHHRAEDAGHDRWFLADLEKIEGHSLEVGEIFSRAHVSTRDMAYGLMFEVHAAQSDVERIVLLLSLEHTGHVFFEKVASYFERQGVVLALRYFARHHIEVEKRHELFEAEMVRQLLNLPLGPEVKERCLRLVDRAFRAFDQLFDGLEHHVVEEAHARSQRAGTMKKRLAREDRLLQSEARLRHGGGLPEPTSTRMLRI